MTGTTTRVAVADLDGVAVTDGPVPERLDGGTHNGPLDSAAPGRYLLALPGVGRVLVQSTVDGGVRVTVERSPGAADDDVAWLLAGPVRQVCWVMRGRFALRGCGVVIDGRATALLGPGASGKSAVTAALARRGHGLLADGALPIRFEPGPVAGPADEHVQLWPDMAGRLGFDDSAGEPVRAGLAKRRHRFDPAGAAPLAAVVVLHRGAGVGALATRPATGWNATGALVAHTAMYPVIEPLGAAARHFQWCTRLAVAVRVVHLRFDRHHGDPHAVADAVEQLSAPGR